MRTTSLKFMKLSTALLLALGMVVFNSCKDDDDDPVAATPVEDGAYIQGDATNFSSPNNNASLSIARNELTQEDRATLLEIYMPIQTGTSGFKIVTVSGSTTTNWGSTGTVEQVQGGSDDQPDVVFQRGTLSSDASADNFNVPADGLYHVVIDTEVNKFIIVPVSHWGIIGGATPGGWSSDQILTDSGFDFGGMTFSMSDIAMGVGDYKFRYGSGWKVEMDSEIPVTNAAGEEFTGIKVNANFGGSPDALVAGGDNIANGESGYYTATVDWTPSNGITAMMTKTGDLPTADFSSVELGLVGDGIVVGGAQHNWDETLFIGTPDQSGDVYTYNFGTVSVTSDGSFKIREGQNWDNISYGFNDVIMAGSGSGALNFGTNGDGNFVPQINAIYTVTLVIDAAADTRTLNFDY